MELYKSTLGVRGRGPEEGGKKAAGICHPPWVCSGDFLGFMLAYVGFMLAYAGLMLAYAGFMLAYVGSSWVKLAHVGSSWPKLASRCVYVGSSWPQDAQDGLPRSPTGQISSIFDPKLVIL